MRRVGTLRIIEIQREARTEFHRGVGVGLPLHTEVAPDVVALILRARTAVEIGSRVGKQILTLLTAARILVGMAVKQITAHSEGLILTADIEVQSQRLRSSDAVAPSETTETVAVAVGEAQLIHIVEVTEQGQLVAAPHAVDIKVSGITVVGTVAGAHVSEPSVVHVFLYGEVYHCLLLAVVNTGQPRKVALAIYHLQFVDHLHRKVFRCHFGVVGKELLAVDKNLLHLLASGRDFTVAVDFDTGKLLQQVLHDGVGLSLVGASIVFDCILLDCDFGLDSGHDSLFQHD